MFSVSYLFLHGVDTLTKLLVKGIFIFEGHVEHPADVQFINDTAKCPNIATLISLPFESHLWTHVGLGARYTCVDSLWMSLHSHKPFQEHSLGYRH